MHLLMYLYTTRMHKFTHINLSIILDFVFFLLSLAKKRWEIIFFSFSFSASFRCFLFLFAAKFFCYFHISTFYFLHFSSFVERAATSIPPKKPLAVMYIMTANGFSFYYDSFLLKGHQTPRSKETVIAGISSGKIIKP